MSCPAWAQPPSEQVRFTLFQVERSKTLTLPTQGRAQVLVVSPEVVEVQSISDNQVVLSALRMGSTVVHLFDPGGRRSIRIEVTELKSITADLQKGLEEALRRKRGLLERSLKLQYRGLYQGLERGVDVSLPGTHEINRIRTHEFKGRMGLPMGLLVGHLYLEERRDIDLGKEVTQPRHLSLELQKVSMGPLGKTDFVAGDKDLYLSDLTLSGKRYRGVGMFPSPVLPTQERKEKWALSVFNGEERESAFLDLPAGFQTRKARSHFAGAQLEYSLWKNKKIHATGLHRYGKAGESKSDDVYALGFDFATDPKEHRLDAEAARDGPHGAYQVRSDSTLLEAFRVRNQFWNVGKEYKTVTGVVPRRGQTGWKAAIDWDLPFWEKAVSLSSNATVFRDRTSLNPANPREINTAYSLGTTARLPRNYFFQASAGYQDDSGSSFPSVTQRFQADLRRDIRMDQHPWIKSLTPFLGSRYELFDKSRDIPGFDGTLHLVRAGLRAGFWRGFWGEVSWSRGVLKEDRPDSAPGTSHPRELALEFGGSHSFDRIPLTASASVRYEDVQDTFQKTHQPFPDRNRLLGDLRLVLNLQNDRELFANLSVSEQTPETAGGNPISEIFAQAGVRLGWDTGWVLTEYGRISGSVFQDLNINGRRDPEEPGLPGIRVERVEGPSATTDPEGYFRFRAVKEGLATVKMDWDQLPKGYFFTTPNAVEILVIPKQKFTVDFGISTEVEFRGRAYDDVNENGTFDPDGDLPIQGIRLFLETGQSAATGPSGFYSIRRTPPGPHTLSVDINSIPEGYRTLDPIRKSFETQEGDIILWDFRLRALQPILPFEAPPTPEALRTEEAPTSKETPPQEPLIQEQPEEAPTQEELAQRPVEAEGLPLGPWPSNRADQVRSVLLDLTIPEHSPQVINQFLLKPFPQLAMLAELHPAILIDGSDHPLETNDLLVKLISRSAYRVDYYGFSSRTLWFQEAAKNALIEVRVHEPTALIPLLRSILSGLSGLPEPEVARRVDFHELAGTLTELTQGR